MENVTPIPDDQGQFELRVERMLTQFGIPDSELQLGVMCQGRQVLLGDLLASLIHASMTVAREEVYKEALADGKPLPQTVNRVIAFGTPGEPGFTPTRRK
jgi:hypothetical protein